MAEMDDEDAHNLRQMAKGGGILLLGAFATKAIMYFYRILVARGLGSEAYGVLSQGLAVFWIFVTLSNLGIENGIQRKVSDYLGKEEEESIPKVLYAALSATIPLSLLAAVTLFFSADYLAVKVFSDPQLSQVFRIFSIAIPFQMLYKNGASLAKAFREMKYITYVDKLYRSLMTFGVTAVLIYLGWGLEGAVIGQFVAIATSGILMMYFAEFKVFPFLRKKFEKDGEERRELLKYSWPIFMSGIVGLSTSWADTLLLGFFSVSATVGVYNAAIPTAKMLIMFSSQMSNVLFPTVSEYYGKGKKKKSVELSSIALKWIYFFTFPGVVIMALFPRQILNLLFGEQYTSGAIALSILASAYFVQTLTTYAGTYINSEDMTKLNLVNSVAISILNVVLNAILIPGLKIGPLVIPKLGIAGAAVATAISLTLGSIIAVLEVYFLFDVNPYDLKKFFPATASTMLAAGTTYFGFHTAFPMVTKLLLIPALAIFGSQYLLYYVLLGGVSDNDREIIKSVEEKTGLELEKYLKEVEKFRAI